MNDTVTAKAAHSVHRLAAVRNACLHTTLTPVSITTLRYMRAAKLLWVKAASTSIQCTCQIDLSVIKKLPTFCTSISLYF
jgi:hypothetical protein